MFESKENKAENFVYVSAGPVRKKMNQIPGEISEICSCVIREGKRKIIANREAGWKLVSKFNTRYHRYVYGPQGKEAKFNRKFVCGDEKGGSVEAVICFPPDKEPYLVTDDVNGGTYNFVSPFKPEFPYTSPRMIWGHWKKDMLPYLKVMRKKKKELKERIKPEEPKERKDND